MKRYLGLVLALCLTMGLFVGCGNDPAENNPDPSADTTVSKQTQGGDPAKEKVVVIAANSEIPSFNPNATRWMPYTTMSLYGAFFQYSEEGHILPDLCEKYEVSEDGKQITFHLVKGVKWHDGEPFSSKDVEYTINAIKENKGNHYKELSNVTVECPDADTVVFKLEKPDATLISMMGLVKFLPAHLYEGTDWLENPTNTHPIGTGPFKFVEYKKGSHVTFEAYDEYYRGRPKIDKLIFKTIPDANTIVQSFINHEIDIIDATGPINAAALKVLENEPDTTILSRPCPTRMVLIPNVQKAPWNDVKVRKAVELAFDRADMAKKAYMGYADAAKGYMTPVIDWAYSSDYQIPERNVEEAKKLLDEAGYKPDANGVRIKDVRFAVSSAHAPEISKIITANLKDIGIECKMEVSDHTACVDKCAAGDFDLTLMGGSDGPDPNQIRVRVGKGGSLNFGKYENPELEKLLDQGSATSDRTERAKIYKEVQKILSEEVPIMPLTDSHRINIIRNYIKGHYYSDPEHIGLQNYFSLEIAE